MLLARIACLAGGELTGVVFVGGTQFDLAGSGSHCGIDEFE